MLSVDGRCKALDAAADGYMRGEACIAHVLEAAVQHMPPCMHGAAAVIMGTSVNQDGRSSSLTAPNGPSQQAVIWEALAWNRLSPLQVNLLEMHGTGTALGDPIEVGAALAVFRVSCTLKPLCTGIFQCTYCADQALVLISSLQGSGKARPLVMQAVKSQILHTEPAAGASGLASLALRMGRSAR